MHLFVVLIGHIYSSACWAIFGHILLTPEFVTTCSIGQYVSLKIPIVYHGFFREGILLPFSLQRKLLEISCVSIGKCTVASESIFVVLSSIITCKCPPLSNIHSRTGISLKALGNVHNCLHLFLRLIMLLSKYCIFSRWYTWLNSSSILLRIKLLNVAM